MSEYLDKLARAAVAAYEEGSGMVTPWELLGEHAQNVARNQVRAVLRLLREPSDRATPSNGRAGSIVVDVRALQIPIAEELRAP